MDIKDLIVNSLEDMKAQDISVIDLAGKTSIADFMIIACGTSDRHLKAIADKAYMDAKQADFEILGVEGENSRDWVLVDFGSVILHVMRPEARANYALEKLWNFKN